MARQISLLIAAAALAAGLALAWVNTISREPPPELARLRQREVILEEEIARLRQEFSELSRYVAEHLPRQAPEGTLTSVSTRDLTANINDEVRKDQARTVPTRGTVAKIDPADTTLVEVELGSGARVGKHDSLEVYREGAMPEYIGTLRVFDIYSQRAICRLVTGNPLKKQALRLGDVVR